MGDPSGEFVLNSNDNWHTNSNRSTAFTGPSRWQHHLSRYFANIRDVLCSEVMRVYELRGGVECAFYPEGGATLRSAETYWEFSSENPVALVASLEPLLRTFSNTTRTTSTYAPVVESEVERNMLCISARISAGRTVRIYAKANRRLRVEVIHDFIGESRFPYAHTTNDWMELVPLLQSLAEDAATVVNEMLQYFNAHSMIPPSHITAMDLVTEIAFHSRQAEIATFIVTQLVTIGSVTSAEVGSPLGRALQRLSQAGVLVNESGYTIAPDRAVALHSLQTHGDITLLSTASHQD